MPSARGRWNALRRLMRPLPPARLLMIPARAAGQVAGGERAGRMGTTGGDAGGRGGCTGARRDGAAR